jgi:Tfp pilus assembly protein PilF/2-polyprenyl-3-methyl-5-hydroxy-6-metoxy-1,4-benzoquinol methylase
MEKIGRNDPCPCGSGKKYKQCCMQLEGFPGEAVRPARVSPELAFELALQHHQAGRLADAEALYRQVLRADPRHMNALNSLGYLAHQAGHGEAAVELIGKAIAEDPSNPVYYNNLGMPLQSLGRLDDAAASYRQAFSLKPDYAEAHYNLGNTLAQQQRFAEAIAAYEAALAIAPQFPEALCNLGGALRSLGEANAALASYVRALAVSDLPEAKNGFVACVRNIRFSGDNKEMRQLVIRAISEPWGMPSDLAAVSMGLVKSNPAVGDCVTRAAQTWPNRLGTQDLYGTAGPDVVAEDLLLQCVLENMQVCDLDLERFLTNVRAVLLQAAETVDAETTVSEKLLAFYCALAQQCFINEYVFDVAPGELDHASAARDKLAADVAAGKTVQLLQLAAVAAYFPLHKLPLAPALGTGSWPEAINRLVTQQVREPAEERRIRGTIRKLTPVEDAAPGSVRQQYEENPFPRWVRLPPAGRTVAIQSMLRHQFPQAPIPMADNTRHTDMLIAGCGTGRHAIEATRQISRARVLAVDLSSASLAYAIRKTRELGISNIEYAQADIMQLAGIGGSFEVIEAVGVLHHLADPKTGWQQLVSLLRPGGFMRLGLYSEAARKTINAARSFVSQHGYKPTPEDIRRSRQELIAAGNGETHKPLLSSVDFFGTSECRDLLFNVREHQFTLPQIKSHLAELGLGFLGFSLAPAVMNEYRARFPDDKAMTNLDSWSMFESENPDTFAGMYQFWAHKPAPITSTP